MDNDKNRRPTQRSQTTVSRERPQAPASRPRPSRPRTGTSSEREAQRRARQTEPEPRQVPRGRAEHSTGQQERERVAQERAARQREQEKAARKKAAKAKAASKKKQKKPHRVYNTNFGFKFVTMLAVVAVIVLSMIIFFKIKHVEVLTPGSDGGGTSYYTAQEIIDASGIHVDDNLLSLSKAVVASRIHTALPYVNEIQVKKQLPGTVIISFSEFEVTYGIQDEAGGWWLISREGRVLESTTEQAAKAHLLVTGMPITVPVLGDYIKPAATEGADLSEIANKRAVTLQVLPALEESPFAKQIVSVDVSTSYDIILWYGTQFEIKLGNTENLTYKLQYLQGVLDQLGREKSGTIDLTFNEDKGAHFLPFG